MEHKAPANTHHHDTTAHHTDTTHPDGTNRKISDEKPCCDICTNIVDIYAIGECGHNTVCWKCILKQRLKLHQLACPICKQTNYKMLLTIDPTLTLAKCDNALYDPDQDIYFEN